MDNREYWVKRLEKLTNSLLKTQEKNTMLFLKTYKDSLTEIQAITNNLYSKYSVDGVLSLTEMYKFDRYNNMEKEIISIIRDLGNEEKKYMTNELKDIYTSSYTKTGELLTNLNPSIKIDFNLINKNAVEKALTYPWSGADFSSRIYSNKGKLITNLQQTLTRGMIEGKSISNMSKDLKGVMDIGATNARRLIRTETMHILGSSHHDVYTKAGIEKVEFITARDDRVCDECDALDGEIFDLNDAPMIPQHSNARSVLIPIID